MDSPESQWQRAVSLYLFIWLAMVTLLLTMKRTQLNRGNSRLKRTGFRKRGDLSGSLSAHVYGLSDKPRTQIARTSMKKRRPSKGPSVDGDDLRTIREDCDQLIRDIIKLRDDRCFTCPETKNLHVGHLFRRGIASVRFDLRNVAAQCDRCNGVHEEEPEHYIGAYVQKFGEVAFYQLKTLSTWQSKLQYTDMISIRDELRVELEKLRESA